MSVVKKRKRKENMTEQQLGPPQCHPLNQHSEARHPFCPNCTLVPLPSDREYLLTEKLEV